MSATATDTDDSDHPYKGLDTPDMNYATWFDPTEVGNGETWDSTSDWYRTKKRNYYQHLEEQNRGRKNGPKWRNDPWITYQMNRHLLQATADSLDLTVTQRKEATEWGRRLDLQRFGVNAEQVAYCICAWVVHSADNDQRECHPSCRDEDLPPEFCRLRDSICWTRFSLHGVYGKVASKIRNWKAGVHEPASPHIDKYEIEEARIRYWTA